MGQVQASRGAFGEALESAVLAAGHWGCGLRPKSAAEPEGSGMASEPGAAEGAEGGAVPAVAAALGEKEEVQGRPFSVSLSIS